MLLPGEFHGPRSPVGYCPWGRRVRHDWVTDTFTSTFLTGLPATPLSSSTGQLEGALWNANPSLFTLSHLLSPAVSYFLHKSHSWVLTDKALCADVSVTHEVLEQYGSTSSWWSQSFCLETWHYLPSFAPELLLAKKKKESTPLLWAEQSEKEAPLKSHKLPVLKAWQADECLPARRRGPSPPVNTACQALLSWARVRFPLSLWAECLCTTLRLTTAWADLLMSQHLA